MTNNPCGNTPEMLTETEGYYSGSGIFVFSNLPINIRIRVPFTSLSIFVGGRNLAQRRRQAKRNPADAKSHISLAALLISQEPLTREYAQEAVEVLQKALSLLDVAPDYSTKGAHLMEAHIFLGDALLALGRIAEARTHWQHGIDLSSIRPPLGLAGVAAKQIEEHPLP